MGVFRRLSYGNLRRFRLAWDANHNTAAAAAERQCEARGRVRPLKQNLRCDADRIAEEPRYKCCHLRHGKTPSDEHC